MRAFHGIFFYGLRQGNRQPYKTRRPRPHTDDRHGHWRRIKHHPRCYIHHTAGHGNKGGGAGHRDSPAGFRLILY